MVNPIVINTWPFTSATHAAYQTLTSSPTASALDAVVVGCSRSEELQDDHTVGWGGSPDENGETTLDALVMVGRDQSVGAVAGLRRIREATKVARDVLRYTKHSMLSGELATAFAVSRGYEERNLTSDWSEKVHQEWIGNGCRPNFWKGDAGAVCRDKSLTAVDGQSKEDASLFNEHNHDTIGQIAMQADGTMAIGMSSNGARHKVPGRVGDAPLPGAGGYVDDEVGACVATGDGDVMMRFCPAFLGVELMRAGKSPQEAADEAIRRIAGKSKVFSGAIVCMDKSGRHAAACQGFQAFSYSVQDGGTSRDHVRVIKIAPLTTPTAEQKVLMESHWGVA